ncbi:MAG: orotate phosphoribosyltransferase [Oscillospiraceae bacterium]|nr:orotate phosphoribosyltransferase [Oscillospiraceae bacterium]
MDNAIVIKSENNNKIQIKVTAGHFATNHSHVNYFIDLTDVKTQYRMAREAGRELAKIYTDRNQIDTIICLEGTEMVGSFLAQDLGHHGMHINSGLDISVIVPETNSNNQLLFWENLQPKIKNKQILLLMSTVSTGKTISRSVECLNYYGGNLVGVAALFSAAKEFNGIEISSLFSTKDCPGYSTVKSTECPLCNAGKKVDAIVNCFGYSKI